MIKEVTMYTVICDNCGADANEGQEYAAWQDRLCAEYSARESYWITKGKMHFCPDCYSYDDNDNLVINGSIQNKSKITLK